MAGAGFKTFNTGDVLTASDVNSYLMQQTVMVFADSSARTTALGANVAEGMISYLKDTNAVEVYNGSAWVSSDDPNAIQNTIVDAKGDIITATAADTPARLAVGSDGYTLVADSSQSTGLGWTNNFAAGKNKIINGDFNIWQRGTSFSNPANNAYTADRFSVSHDGTSATRTISQQTFTAGTAPVAGYEGTYFYRYAFTAVGSGNTYNTIITQRIEDVRTFAGQTVTVSFWAKADANRTFTLRAGQNFGSGGSSATSTDGTVSLTTSWARYSVTLAIPSISGKTIGSSSYIEFFLFEVASPRATYTIDIWGYQVEAGSVATAFQTATGNPASELAACQRYYTRFTAGSVYTFFCNGNAYNTTVATCILPLPVTLRTSATSIDTSGTASHFRLVNGATATACSSVPTLDQNSTQSVAINFTVASGLTAGQAINVSANNTSSAYIGVNAEL